MNPARFLALPLLGAFLAAQPVTAAEPPAGIAFASYEEPRFPAALASTPVTDGQATIAFTYRGDGTIADLVAVSATHPAFADSVVDAARAWQLQPFTSSGPEFPRREQVTYSFRRQGALISLNHRDQSVAVFRQSLDHARPLRLVPSRKLPAPPTPLHAPLPAYPATLDSVRTNGSAAVSFIVDTTGAVRVPVILAADRHEFAQAVLATVSAWRFAPPVLNGQPVTVEMRQRISFAAPR